MIKRAVKKSICLLLCVLTGLALGGCWSYRGINETTIITGIAVDKDASRGVYRITFEIVDLTRDIKQTGVHPKLVEAEGKTIFDTVRNAKKRLINKLYFGNAQTIVVSQEIAREGIFPVVEWFLRDAECRETIILAVSQEKSAKELFSVKGIDEMLIAYELRKIVEEDQQITSSTQKTELYDIYNTLKEPGISLVVPAFRNVANGDQLTVEVNGVAIFKGDRFIGFLDPYESMDYLLIVNQLHAGVLTLPFTEGGDGETGQTTDDVSLEIYRSETDMSCTYADGKAIAHIRIETEVSLDELGVEVGPMDEAFIAALEGRMAEKLEGEIIGLVKKVQVEFGSDIFGFGNALYKRDPAAWHGIESRWDELFKTLEVDIACEIRIVNTASLMQN